MQKTTLAEKLALFDSQWDRTAKAVRRRPAENEVKVLLIEPKGDANTGDSGASAAAKDHL